MNSSNLINAVKVIAVLLLFSLVLLPAASLAKSFAELSDEQQRILQNFAEERRQLLRKRWQSLDEERKEMIRQRLRNTTPEERRELRRKWRQSTPAERRKLPKERLE